MRDDIRRLCGHGVERRLSIRHAGQLDGDDDDILRQCRRELAQIEGQREDARHQDQLWSIVIEAIEGDQRAARRLGRRDGSDEARDRRGFENPLQRDHAA
jgi:hypothetical protein